MKNKKVLLMGVALLGLSVLAGCGNPSRPSSSSQPGSQPGSQPASSEAK